MLKRLLQQFWWVAVGLAVLWVVAFVAKKEHTASVKYERDREARCVEWSSTPAEQEKCKHERDSRDNYLPWEYVLIAWPEGITTWALLATLAVIAVQTYQTRRSADAAAEAANAAYGSVTFAEAQWKLMVEEKRARLDLSVQPTELDVVVAGEDLVHLIATISVRNIGASKAFIGRASGALITKLRNEALGGYDDCSPLDLSEKAIAPDQPAVAIKIYCFPTATAQTFAECLEEGTFNLHFFGFIEYETLGFWRRKEFGYEWDILGRDSGLGELYGLSDPYPNSPRPARDRITYGYWRLNEEIDRPEYPMSKEHDAGEK
jgi:hypothetical protein